MTNNNEVALGVWWAISWLFAVLYRSKSGVLSDGGFVGFSIRLLGAGLLGTVVLIAGTL